MGDTIRLRNGQTFRLPDYDGWDDVEPIDEDAYYEDFDREDYDPAYLDELAAQEQYEYEQEMQYMADLREQYERDYPGESFDDLGW